MKKKYKMGLWEEQRGASGEKKKKPYYEIKKTN